MVRGLMVLILGLCLTFVMTFRACAQQNPPTQNPNEEQIQQIRQDMQAIREQLEPLHAQVKALRQQMFPLEQKLKADREKLRALHGNHHGPFHHQVARGEGQEQHPSSEPTTNSVAN